MKADKGIRWYQNPVSFCKVTRFLLVFWSSPVFLGFSSSSVLAEYSDNNSDNIASQSTLEQLQRYSQEGRKNTSASQVTSVSQLSDVQPTDWAFQALQSLVERFGCIAGYPDGTFKGNRSLTRYEFAAGLNACVERINELLNAAVEDSLTENEFIALQRLQNEFAAELSLLRGQVSRLEERTEVLVANQFYTTTKLTGEGIFAITDAWGDDIAFQGTEENRNQTVFQNRVRLNFNTSFTGEDLLLTRLQMGNAQPFDLGFTRQGTQTFNFRGDTDSKVELERLYYQFPITNQLQLILAAKGVTWDDFVPTVNPYLDDRDGGNGSLSTFGQRNPIYRIGGGRGMGLHYRFNEQFLNGIFGSTSVSVGYLSASAGDASQGNGLFNGDYATLAQITVTPRDNLQLAFTYNHAYSTPGNFGFDNGLRNGLVVDKNRGNINGNAINGVTGSGIANSILGLSEGINPGRIASGVVSNSYGVQVSWRINRKIVLSGWGGYTDARVINIGDGQIWNFAVTLGLPDLFKEGSLGGIVIGREPYLNDIDAPRDLKIEFPNDQSWHLEAFYRYPVNDKISITPGIIFITNPNQDSRNDDIVIGTLRTTFSF
ncbi:MAG: iron uptake porin [Limnoraphis robusta]|uniref:iron uptake porin n=1 Tax=Limnoraphis robusta TaxID=1118279 RepID=UPI0009E31E9D|nr:iron uptake porin [Limnoraphis robusta]